LAHSKLHLYRLVRVHRICSGIYRYSIFYYENGVNKRQDEDLELVVNVKEYSLGVFGELGCLNLQLIFYVMYTNYLANQINNYNKLLISLNFTFCKYWKYL